VVTDHLPNVVSRQRSRRHSIRNVLLEKLKEQRFFDPVVGKGNTEIPPRGRINLNSER